MVDLATRKPDYRAIKTKAEDILARYNVIRPPVPIKDIAENEGVNVVFVRFSSLHDKVAGFTKFDEAKIYVNGDDSLNRQMFTIAHEFGHWILHRDLFEKEPDKYNVLLRTPLGVINKNPLEKEANAFAGAILAPAFMLKEIKDNATTLQMARIFAVSPDVIGFRLKYV